MSTEPWNDRGNDDELSDEERRVLERLRKMPGEAEVNAIEDRPEMARAAEADTTVDPRSLDPDRRPSETADADADAAITQDTASERDEADDIGRSEER